MYLIINGYQFGQWLLILLWVGLPVTMFLAMWTTWFHYQHGRTTAQLLLTVEGLDEGGGFSIEPEELSNDLRDDVSNDLRVDGRVETGRSVKDGEDDFKENLYKGILWMKEKYEQYRALADERYERLKDQLTRMEQKYEDLLTKVQAANPGLLEMSVPTTEMAVPVTEVVVEQVEGSGDRVRIKELEEQQVVDRQKIDELVIKLRNNSQLLMNIYQELDKSLHYSDTPSQG